ncbi:hypothetical protein [Lysobacter gummosus]|uniref:hypothetical protein n=1 Tax=Lysobacter gummosus TaxID=262324 RepID=UPI003645D21B
MARRPRQGTGRSSRWRRHAPITGRRATGNKNAPRKAGRREALWLKMRSRRNG